MNLPAINSQNKGKAILIGYVIFCCLYMLSGNYHLYTPVQFHMTFIDRNIPFFSGTILMYLSQFLFLFLELWCGDNVLRRTKAYYAMLIATAIAIFVFIIFPVKLPRQDIQFQGAIGFFWHGLYIADTSSNCFPSLHVALAVIALNILVSLNKFWQLLAPFWAFLICLSTLTTKQHYFVDVLGGLVLAFVSLKLVNPLIIVENIHEKYCQQN